MLFCTAFEAVYENPTLKTAPIYHTWVILLNHHPNTAHDGNPGKHYPAPLLFLVLFGSPAMNWDHAVSWGKGVWVSVSDVGRVGHTGSGGWPTGFIYFLNEFLAVWLGWWFGIITHVW